MLPGATRWRVEAAKAPELKLLQAEKVSGNGSFQNKRGGGVQGGKLTNLKVILTCYV